jgi:hypothetical protein
MSVTAWPSAKYARARSQIGQPLADRYARADALADRIISLWPGPVLGGGGGDVAWDTMNRALARTARRILDDLR